VIEHLIPSLALGVLNSCPLSKNGNVPIALWRWKYLELNDEIEILAR
jgi:hypothetical protein